MSAADKNALRIFLWKVVRTIYDPVREGERLRIRSNREVEEILGGEDVVKVHWMTLLLPATVLMTDRFYSYEVVSRRPDRC
jgi:hypothetical protein